MSVFYSQEGGIGRIVFDRPDSKVNILTAETLATFKEILDQIAKETNVKAVVLESAKPGYFIVGADIAEIHDIRDPQEGIRKAQMGQAIFNQVEGLPVPTVAVVDGMALGGGFELICACTSRVATFSDKVLMGLPEVNLGIIPGFGGTVRLPKLIGLEAALRLIPAGRLIKAEQALRYGCVDRLFPSNGLKGFVDDYVQDLIAAKNLSPRPSRKKGRSWFLEKTPIGRAILFDQAQKQVLKVTKGRYPAPLEAVSVIRRHMSMPRDEALRCEAEAFGRLVVTDICKNLIHVYYLQEGAKKLSVPEAGTAAEQIVKKAFVLGAGVMGGGIAQLLAYSDIPVRMKDLAWEALGKGMQSAAQIFQRAVKRRKVSPAEAHRKMALISATVDDTGIEKADVVFEAVVEDQAVKNKIFEEISLKTKPDALLCTNTSALSVSGMAAKARHPERVVGFHFFNPVHRMPLVEIVQGQTTSPETLARAIHLARQLRKTPILVQDAPGFLVNRVLLSYVNEAGRLLEEGGDIQKIDAIMETFGMPMGPFRLSDEVGLDVGLKVLKILHAGCGERFAPAAVFETIVAKGLKGKKGGGGFYRYQGKRRRVNPDVVSWVRGGASRLTWDDDRARDRMILIMINEAARCLEDGVVADAASVDIGMIMGTGFPPFRGGLLRYADSLGAESLVHGLRILEKKCGERFRPAEFLLTLKKTGKSFYS